MKSIKSFIFGIIVFLLACSVSLAESITLSPGTHTSGSSFSPGYWYIQPAEGEIILITYRLPEADAQSLILTGLSHPFGGAKVTTAINMELPEGTTLTVYGGDAILQPGQESLVWVSKSGSKYHRVADCSKMKEPQSMTEAEALAAGKEPCSNCCK